MSADWIRQARCDGVDQVFFFPKTELQERIGKAICAVCPVQLQCLRGAKDRREHHGIWGGKNFEKEMSESTCRRCSKDFEHAKGPARPWYCSDKCRDAAARVAKSERSRRYRGNPEGQPVGL